MKPLVIDLFCGLGGWAEGFLAEGYTVIGFDIERRPYPGQLVLQDALTLHGSQFRKAACIVASPPCQKYSYMAMPWTRAKELAGWYKFLAERQVELNALFDACFRIQREASEAAGRQIPMVVENVKGAQPWVGRAKWHYGSFYLWGDVPALMPFTWGRKSKLPPGNNRERRWEDRPIARLADATKNDGGSWFNQAHNTESGHGQNPDGRKVPSESGRRTDIGNGVRFTTRDCGIEGRKQEGSGAAWLDNGLCKLPSGSSRRAQASAKIAMIPFPLAQHIARTFYPSTSCAQ